MCIAPDGTSIEYKTNDKLDDGSSIFIKPDVGGGYVRVGTAPKPGFVSALFLGIAVISLGLGIGGHIYLRNPSQIDMFNRTCRKAYSVRNTAAYEEAGESLELRR